jgi:hypothetical protein
MGAVNKKVIYISFIRLTDKTSRDWFVDYLIEKGLEVEYWDIVALVRENYDEAAAKVTKYLSVLSTYKELEHRLSLETNKNTHYVILVSYAQSTIKFFRLLSKHNCKMYYFAWGSIPVLGTNKLNRITTAISNPTKTIIDLSNKIRTYLNIKFKLIKPFHVVFAAGEVMLTTRHNARKIVPINFADYTQYQKTICDNIHQIVDGSYAVFLDVYMPFHSDFEVLGWSKVEPNAYYSALNRFFEKLEKKYNISIVIAAHPRADYSRSNPFNYRQIFQGQVPVLVKYADFVISHSSLSQSYAIFNNKPIIFTYTNDMLSIYGGTSYMREIYDASSYLDAAIFNIDEINNENQIYIKNVNPLLYEKFMHNFLVSRESRFESTQEIFWREISGKEL